MTLITKEFLLNNRTDKGAWNKKQLEILGIPWPPVNGWHSKVIGKYLSTDQVKDFIKNKSKDKKN